MSSRCVEDTHTLGLEERFVCATGCACVSTLDSRSEVVPVGNTRGLLRLRIFFAVCPRGNAPRGHERLQEGRRPV